MISRGCSMTVIRSDTAIPMTDVPEPTPPPQAVLSVRLPVSYLTLPVVCLSSLSCVASFSCVQFTRNIYLETLAFCLTWLSQSVFVLLGLIVQQLAIGCFKCIMISSFRDVV